MYSGFVFFRVFLAGNESVIDEAFHCPAKITIVPCPDKIRDIRPTKTGSNSLLVGVSVSRLT
jgi:hypothetical protein